MASQQPEEQKHAAAEQKGRFQLSDEDEEDDSLLEEGGPQDEEDLQQLRAGAAGNAAGQPAPAPAQSDAASGEDPSPIWPIAFWILCSSATIMFNKWLYVGPFPFPITLTCIHMMSASAICGLLRVCRFLDVPALGWPLYLRSVVPIGVLYALSLAMSNEAAQRLSVSFIQMLKATMPMATLGVGIALRLETPNWKQAVIVAFLVGGVMISSAGELLFDGAGVLFQCVSVVSESCRLIITQKLLQQHLPKGSSPLASIALFAPPAMALLLPVASTLEPDAWVRLADPVLVLAGIIGANVMVAFTLNISVVLLVGRTSGLTLTLAGVVKDILLILISIFLFHNPVTGGQVGGYFLALYGLNLYDQFKADKDAPLLELARRAATNRRMLLIAVSTAVVYGVATTRLHLDHWAR